MKVLAVNTANALLSLSLMDGDKELHAYETAETRDQGNLLLTHIMEAMEQAGLDYEKLDLLAVVTGPGSFTGIRIGLAAMRAMALAAGVPVIGVSSFELFAVPQKTNIICLESWRDELYFQVNGQGGETLIPPVSLTPEDFVPKLSAVPKPYVLSGDAAEKLARLIKDAALYGVKVTAADAARIAVQKFAAQGGKAERPVPFYLRDADITMPK